MKFAPDVEAVLNEHETVLDGPEEISLPFEDAVRREMINRFGADWQQASEFPLEERPGWKALGEVQPGEEVK